jgi:hypothetical protein
MKKLITILALLLPGLLAHAQQYSMQNPASALTQNQPALSATGAAISAAPPMAFNSPVSLQVLVGTQGFGADVKYGILPKLSARLGFSIAPVNAERGLKFSSFPVNGELNARFANVHLMADYAPFNSRFIRLVGGAAYLIKGNANVLISSVDGYSIGNRTLSKDQIGVIDAGVNWRGFAPYAGISLFRPFPAHRVNVNLDLGSYYLSRPGTSFTGTNLLADNEANARQFNENMKGYRWMPVMQLNFNIKIK